MTLTFWNIPYEADEVKHQIYSLNIRCLNYFFCNTDYGHFATQLEVSPNQFRRDWKQVDHEELYKDLFNAKKYKKKRSNNPIYLIS